MKLGETSQKVVTYNWSSKDSPVWGLLKTALITACFGGLLHTFSSNFDKTEIKTLVWGFIMAFLLEGVNVRHKLRTFWGGDERRPE